jgi:hypothetical protein
MARTRFVGKAQAIAGVYECTIPSISAGQRIGLAINNKSVAYTAVEGDTIKTAAAGLASAWNASTEPEHEELTAAASNDKVVLTADVPGVPHTITTDTSGGIGASITISRLQAAVAPVNQQQFITLPGSPTGGTWALDFHTGGAGGLAYNASAATVETHLEGIAEIGSGNVEVSGATGGPYTIEFVGALAGKKMPPLLVNAAGLTLAANNVVVEVEESEPWLGDVMAWEITRPDAAWALRQGGRETWVLDSNATIQEIEQAIESSLDVGSVRIERAISSNGSIVYRIFRKGFQAYVQPDIPLESITWTDPGATIGRSESAVTIYQDPADLQPDTPRSATWKVRFRPNINVNGKVSINGSLNAINESLYVLTGSSTDLLRLAVIEALEAANSAGTMSYNHNMFTIEVDWIGEGPTHGRDLSITLSTTQTTARIDPLVIDFVISSVTGGEFYADVTRLAIAGKSEVHKLITENATGGTYTLTNDFGSGNETTSAIAHNATAATLQAAIVALTSVSSGDVLVYGDAGGPYAIVWGGALENTIVDLFSFTSSLTSAPSVSLAVTTRVAATGPNFFDAAKNWSEAAIPSTGDVLIFRDTAISLLYGLSQAAITPAAIEFHSTFTGSVGLSDTNQNGYPEYRQTALRIGQASDATTVDISVRGGSNRIRLDSGNCPVTLQISDTGINDAGDPAAFRWTGTAATNTAIYLAGSVLLGSESGAAAAIDTLRIASDGGSYGFLELAEGLVVTTVQHTGGSLTSRATITTANIGGAWTQDGGAITTLSTLPGGSVSVLGSPTITTLDVGSSGIVSFSSANAPTVTNARISSGGTIIDSQGSVTFTNGIELVLCGLADVSLDVGQSKTIEIS